MPPCFTPIMVRMFEPPPQKKNKRLSYTFDGFMPFKMPNYAQRIASIDSWIPAYISVSRYIRRSADRSIGLSLHRSVSRSVGRIGRSVLRSEYCSSYYFRRGQTVGRSVRRSEYNWSSLVFSSGSVDRSAGISARRIGTQNSVGILSVVA